MFGDAGHGFIMFLAALTLVLKERQIKSAKSQNEIFNMFFMGRYLILLMGIFSIYTGFMYNDVFAKSVNIFGSAWQPDSYKPDFNITLIEEKTLDPIKNYANPAFYTGPYYFGLDPMWQVAKNKILFLNSYKMKLSVILGVIQMLFGIFLSFWNYTYFKNTMNIFTQFIPEIIFIVSIFGYMNTLIFYKWITFDSSQSGCAPSILIQLINMFLFKYSNETCQVDTFYTFQKPIQIGLILLAVICIPWMLAIKPFILYQRHKESQLHKSVVNYSTHNNNATDGLTSSVDQISVSVTVEQANGIIGDHEEEGEKEEFDFGEIAIHQGSNNEQMKSI